RPPAHHRQPHPRRTPQSRPLQPALPRPPRRRPRSSDRRPLNESPIVIPPTPTEPVCSARLGSGARPPVGGRAPRARTPRRTREPQPAVDYMLLHRTFGRSEDRGMSVRLILGWSECPNLGVWRADPAHGCRGETLAVLVPADRVVSLRIDVA